jgi:hypothetical protein
MTTSTATTTRSSTTTTTSGSGGRYPDKVVGIYIILADDTVEGFHTNDLWKPILYEYQQTGANVLFFTFINPGRDAVSHTILRTRVGIFIPGQAVLYPVIKFISPYLHTYIGTYVGHKGNKVSSYPGKKLPSYETSYSGMKLPTQV